MVCEAAKSRKRLGVYIQEVGTKASQKQTCQGRPTRSRSKHLAQLEGMQTPRS